jgi:UDP-glucose 4-epimerase
MNVLVTGGCGYIGSHTVVYLLESGYNVIVVDNLSNSRKDSLDGIKSITGKDILFYQVDLCKIEESERIFVENKIDIVIHFAALKSVPESILQPERYMSNNIDSLNNLIDLSNKYYVSCFVFSSSCSVYGDTTYLPVTEMTPMGIAKSPYAKTKQLGEELLNKKGNFKKIILRYFNPIGSHPSLLIGDLSNTNSLVSSLCKSAEGEMMYVYGNDYPTKDGTCIRDFIHVCDIASAHVKSINLPNSDIFNLGTGNGVTILESIKSFEDSNNLKLNYKFGPRRDGDVISIYTNRDKSTSLLGWEPLYTLKDMMFSSYEWYKKKL